MQISAAMPIACSQIWRAVSSVLRNSARAAASAKPPPEPIEHTPSSGAAQRAALLAQLVVEALEQRDAVCGRAGEATDGPAFAEASDFPRPAFDDLIAERHLAVARDHDLRAAANGKDRRRVDLGLHERVVA